MSERGEYRSFYTALADDPDIHTMSPVAFKLFAMLKLSLPATAIGVVYPSKLCDQVGVEREELERAFGELEAPKGASGRGWIVRDRNVVWIVNAFACEPNLTPTNVRKHVPFVRRLVAQLNANLPIVQAFKEHYRQWFDGESKGYANPINRVSNPPSDPENEGNRKGNDTLSKQKPSLDKTIQNSGDLDRERGATADAPTGPSASAPLSLVDLPEDVVAFGARFYRSAEPKRRRDIAEQLCRLANGASIDYKGQPVRAGSVDRLVAACRSIRALEKPDSAIAYLLAKLGDTTELTAAQVARDKAERASDERATEHDLAAADAWLSDRPDIAADIDATLEAQGFGANSDDAYAAMCRSMMRNNLVLRAWRAARAPEAAHV